MASFLQRRLAGDYRIDEFGFDDELMAEVLLPLLRLLHRHYWRVTSDGAGRLPDGGGLLVANHAGALPADVLMTQVDVFEQTGRHLRALSGEFRPGTPFVGPLGRKAGAAPPGGEDLRRLLEAGELVGVWPEGFSGLGKPYGERYTVQRFGRDGFIEAAVEVGVPIIPTAIVGSEEIYPLLFNAKGLARVLGLPYLPVVAQLLAVPVLGPLALLPLPSRWSITYGRPLGAAPDGDVDPMIAFDLTERVRDTIQEMLVTELRRRTSTFL